MKSSTLFLIQACLLASCLQLAHGQVFMHIHDPSGGNNDDQSPRKAYSGQNVHVSTKKQDAMLNGSYPYKLKQSNVDPSNKTTPIIQQTTSIIKSTTVPIRSSSIVVSTTKIISSKTSSIRNTTVIGISSSSTFNLSSSSSSPTTAITTTNRLISEITFRTRPSNQTSDTSATTSLLSTDTRTSFTTQTTLSTNVSSSFNATRPSSTATNTSQTFTTSSTRTLTPYPSNTTCVFPFKYTNKLLYTCITDGRDKPWCSTTSDYDTDLKWKYCNDNLIKTTGGNANGAACNFPFKYQDKLYYECVDREHVAPDGSVTFAKFCGTTDDYDRDKTWGYCMDYAKCHFPFLYQNNLYTDCVSSPFSPSFCSTSYNFTQTKSWVHCPVVCSGFPEKSSNVIGFRYLYHQRPCDLRQHKNQLNGMKLRDYVVPPCQFEYLCEPGYQAIYSEIECRSDGIYDRKATCVASNNRGVMRVLARNRN